jgi:hypothetical protein
MNNIIDYFLYNYSSAEFIIILTMLFGQDAVNLAAQFSIITIQDQVAYLNIH